MHAAGAALILGAVIAGLVVGAVLFQAEIEPPKEFTVSTGLAYLRLKAEKIVDDPVLGNGTLLTYVAEIVVINEDDELLVLRTAGLSLPSTIYVYTSNCSSESIEVNVTVTRVGADTSVQGQCLTPLAIPPNKQAEVVGGYLTVDDLLLGAGSDRALPPSSEYYIPPGYELHYKISGAVLIPEPADSEIWARLSEGHVLAVVTVAGTGYDVKGSFHDITAINATLTQAPDGSLYYLGPYDHIIANTPEEAEILPSG